MIEAVPTSFAARGRNQAGAENLAKVAVVVHAQSLPERSKNAGGETLGATQGEVENES